MGQTAISLSGHVRLDAAEALALDLASALGGGGEVLVDTGAADSLDVAIVQVLVAAHRSAAERGARLSVRAPEGGALARAFLKLGIGAACDLPPVWTGDCWTGLREREM